MREVIGSVIRQQWDRWNTRPAGKAIFNRMLRFMIPYTGTIHPRVLDLRPGYARVEMRDRRAVRNHLQSVHAIALMNVAELTTGLAFSYALPASARFILKSLSMDYLKKARGTLTAECTSVIPDTSVQQEYRVDSVVRDVAGDVVARAQAVWLLGPATLR
jgi:acyl-coenzyme A thioesterase PaaI-like protein